MTLITSTFMATTLKETFAYNQIVLKYKSVTILPLCFSVIFVLGLLYVSKFT